MRGMQPTTEKSVTLVVVEWTLVVGPTLTSDDVTHLILICIVLIIYQNTQRKK
jgi:hypothetical protein